MLQFVTRFLVLDIFINISAFILGTQDHSLDALESIPQWQDFVPESHSNDDQLADAPSEYHFAYMARLNNVPIL